MRDHGGDLDTAMARYGGTPEAWIDLSTGINPRPYPVPSIPEATWARLPTKQQRQALEAAAARAYGASAPVLATAGATAVIQALPRLGPVGQAAVLGPTYNEHAAAFAAAGWDVAAVTEVSALEGADVAVVVNPNNPDGRRHKPEALLALAARVGRLVVDESFVDTEPELSLVPHLDPGQARILVQRSFGKTYGLAGLRLGFAIGGPEVIAALAEQLGPWPVSGPAIVAGTAALSDPAWLAATRARLEDDSRRLDALVAGTGAVCVGGTDLFHSFRHRGAGALHVHLARAWIWTRVFPYDAALIRFGLPGDEAAWAHLDAALGAFQGGRHEAARDPLG